LPASHPRLEKMKKAIEKRIEEIDEAQKKAKEAKKKK
jgi:hypothetical protein